MKEGNLINSTARKSNESMDAYLIRLFENKEAYGLTSQDIADILNADSGWTFSESTYRKQWSSYVHWRDFIKAQSHASPIEEMQEIAKERVRLRDERTELNKRIREQARSEDFWRELGSQIADNAKQVMPRPENHYVTTVDGTVLVCLSDLHYGLVIDSGVQKNRYDSDIALKRLGQYYDRIKAEAKRSGHRRCVVALMGDMIHGNIHTTCRISNRENLIDQIKGVSSCISAFIWWLSEHFDTIRVLSVSGNHSRVDSEKDALNEERLDKIVPWYLKASLAHLHNVEILEDDCSHVAMLDIEGHEFWFAHGDFDEFTEAGVYKLAACLHRPAPYAMVFGHMHQTKYLGDTVHLLQSGCLCGAGDEYTTKKRLGSSPSQLMALIGSDGLTDVIPVTFQSH